MVAPLALSIIGLVASAAPTALNISSKVSKFYGKYGNTSLGQATQFGIGYGAATNIGYNVSNQLTSGLRPVNTAGKTVQYRLDKEDRMPYYRNNYQRQRKIRVWSRRYRRYIWVYPRRRY